MSKFFFPVMLVLLLTAGCSKPSKRADTPKELAKAILDALKADDVEQILPYYITQKEAKNYIDDFVEDDEDNYMSSIYSVYDIDEDEKKDKGFSESKLENYFANDRGHFRKDFKSVISDAKDKEIKWSKVKFDRVELPVAKKRKRGDEPAWIRIWCKEGNKSFYIFIQNAVKTEQGWTCGLSMKLSENILGNELEEMMDAIQQIQIDSLKMADSLAKVYGP